MLGGNACSLCLAPAAVSLWDSTDGGYSTGDTNPTGGAISTGGGYFTGGANFTGVQ
ncbi:hypothetical protein PF005_g3723 [Phytophthora fragariae]|uniref:Uncharacterized protein n=1 Tax=Phytophthora fragariae TaxID=53985 RepID=A0A6A3URD8_9STRA|nr:hypothetical protein PF003_g35086 [Phytophthora fragariae]KAE8947164.1 hypothetical protein PF009_g3220 [Phytophthora fragariae]KAE9025861.1 hypothetical protein PF011_g2837 [Phytophthora fragariae]KAE9132600.1 hypothetical protein PF007_g3657 [Phytophthora fragariae]KAE9133206.1 hypothetical protein PF010_g2897 [Phytophthora fragariae]